MAQPDSKILKRTPLDVQHRALGARMVASAGWDMPYEYSGLANEHLAVRTRAGLFDLSHMGQLEIAGKDALAAVQWLTCNDASLLQNGQAQYSGLLTPEGTFVDDLFVHRLADQHFLLVLNAANVDKDVAWIRDQLASFGDAFAVDTSARYALLALQGPWAQHLLQRLTDLDLSTIHTNWFAHGEVAGARATMSRTGYTGEDGFEVFVPPKQATGVWNAILLEGQEDGVVPAGLGARESLRLEAGLRLYGNDIDAGTTVLDADLEWIVRWNKGNFVGRDSLVRQKEQGVTRRLVGFEMDGHPIVKPGLPVFVDGDRIGIVTSGAQAPSLNKTVGLAYLPVGRGSPGAPIDVKIEGVSTGARVVPLPFYTRAKG